MLYGGSVEFEKSRSVYIKDSSGYDIELSEISGGPAPGYGMSLDEEVVVFLKSQSKSGYDYYCGTANTGNEHGEFWFEQLIPRYSQNNKPQNCSIQCLVHDLVYGEDGITYACGYEDAACHGVDVDYAGE